MIMRLKSNEKKAYIATDMRYNNRQENTC